MGRDTDGEDRCILLPGRMQRRRSFTIEHPAYSIARHLSGWDALEAEVGFFIPRHHCMFWQPAKRTYEIIITSMSSLRKRVGRACDDNKIFPRTGLQYYGPILLTNSHTYIHTYILTLFWTRNHGRIHIDSQGWRSHSYGTSGNLRFGLCLSVSIKHFAKNKRLAF